MIAPILRSSSGISCGRRIAIVPTSSRQLKSTWIRVMVCFAIPSCRSITVNTITSRESLGPKPLNAPCQQGKRRYDPIEEGYWQQNGQEPPTMITREQLPGDAEGDDEHV